MFISHILLVPIKGISILFLPTHSASQP